MTEKSKEEYLMQKGFQAQRQRKIALILSSLILLEVVIAFCLLTVLIISSGSFRDVSPMAFVEEIAALGCLGVMVLAGKKFYAAFTWREWL
jgi:hypothetical protein